MIRTRKDIPLGAVNAAAAGECSCDAPVSPIIPVVSVSSVNGQTGDVQLRNLIIGNQTYNGSNEVVMTLEDFELDNAVRYMGAVAKRADLYALKAGVGDLYYCIEDRRLFLCRDTHGVDWISIYVAIDESDIKKITINNITQPVIEGVVDIPKADADKFGVVKLSKEFKYSENDDLIIDFDKVDNSSICAGKLKGTLWLVCDETVTPPADNTGGDCQ